MNSPTCYMQAMMQQMGGMGGMGGMDPYGGYGGSGGYGGGAPPPKEAAILNSHEEIEEFLDDCGVETLDKIQNFMSAAPRLNYKLVYTNSSGKERVIELTSLTDFFMLR